MGIKAYLNHFYFVIDKETYNELLSCEFITKNFCNYKEYSTTDSEKNTWTALYLFGEKTYLEVFKEEEGKWKLGTAAVALGFEEIGEIEKLYERLKNKDKKKFTLKEKKLPFNDKDILWFKLIEAKDESPEQKFRFWCMEYDKDFLNKSINEDIDDISRQRYQKSCFKSDKLLREITEITLALKKSEREEFVDVLIKCDYGIENLGGKLIAKGEDITFVLIPAKENREGVREIRTSIEGEPLHSNITIGNITIYLSDNKKEMVWKIS